GASASLPRKKTTLWGTGSWLSKPIWNGRLTGPARQFLLKAMSLAAIERGLGSAGQPLAASFLALTSQGANSGRLTARTVKRIAWWASPQYSVHWPPKSPGLVMVRSKVLRWPGKGSGLNRDSGN